MCTVAHAVGGEERALSWGAAADDVGLGQSAFYVVRVLDVYARAKACFEAVDGVLGGGRGRVAAREEEGDLGERARVDAGEQPGVEEGLQSAAEEGYMAHRVAVGFGGTCGEHAPGCRAERSEFRGVDKGTHAPRVGVKDQRGTWYPSARGTRHRYTLDTRLRTQQTRHEEKRTRVRRQRSPGRTLQLHPPILRGRRGECTEHPRLVRENHVDGQRGREPTHHLAAENQYLLVRVLVLVHNDGGEVL